MASLKAATVVSSSQVSLPHFFSPVTISVMSTSFVHPSSAVQWADEKANEVNSLLLSSHNKYRANEREENPAAGRK